MDVDNETKDRESLINELKRVDEDDLIMALYLIDWRQLPTHLLIQLRNQCFDE